MLQEVRRAARRFLGPDDQELLVGNSLQYSYADLAAATDGFRIEQRLGAGAAGTVYRGALRGGTEVAVKVLEAASSASAGGVGGFEEELRVLSRFRHPNLVTLLGWGEAEASSRTKFLVYELLLGGDLCQRLLRSQSGASPFLWQQRLRVALDAACGLSYMVNSTPRAFHRDIKPPNILLDIHGTGKMADFGLSETIRKPGQGHLTVEQISGTPGYADPAYCQSGRVTEQSEVYSFGVVLLETLLNERAALLGPGGEVLFPLVMIVQPAAPGALERILTRLEASAGWSSPSAAAELAALALSCVCRVEARPAFENLVGRLRHLNQTAAAAAAAAPPPPAAAPMGPGLPPRQDGAAAAALDLTRKVPVWGEPALPLPAPARRAGFSSVGDTADDAPLAPPPRPLGAPAAVLLGRCRPPPAADTEGKEVEPRPPPTSGRNLVLLGNTVAEVVFEAVSAEGFELAALPAESRSLAFAVRMQSSRFSAVVGRQRQPDFFEEVLSRGSAAALVSRAHFEVSLMPGAGGPPMLRRLSGNPLLVDGLPLERQAATALRHGSTVGFCGMAEGSGPFLVLRVLLRSRSDVAKEGPHLALARWGDGMVSACTSEEPEPVPGGVPPPTGTRLATAFLECSHAQGREAASLRWLEPGARAVALPAAGQAVELGRLRQPSFFEQLLQTDSAWLAFISRSHCRVTLQTSADGLAQAAVENLSANAILVGGCPIGRGQSATLLEGGSLAFIARRSGDAAGRDVEFLRFVLRAGGEDGQLPEPEQATTVVRL